MTPKIKKLELPESAFSKTTSGYYEVELSFEKFSIALVYEVRVFRNQIFVEPMKKFYRDYEDKWCFFPIFAITDDNLSEAIKILVKQEHQKIPSSIGVGLKKEPRVYTQKKDNKNETLPDPDDLPF
jgi:hypothetical protein